MIRALGNDSVMTPSYESDAIAIAAVLCRWQVPKEPRSCAQREAQAIVTSAVARGLMEAGYEVIIAGDMNDFSATAMDIQGSMPSSQVTLALFGRHRALVICQSDFVAKLLRWMAR